MSCATTSSIILPQIEALSRLIRERIGLDFPRRKWDMLQRVVEELAIELNFSDPQPLLEELLYSPLNESRLNLLIARLTVGETYFLRDKNIFTTLRDHIFPALIEQKVSERRLDLWCAASSTGEEAYSIAMLLDEKADLLENWQINIRASDINLEVLEKAKRGVYSQWSLRATPEAVTHRYFSKIGKNQFLLARHIREMVSFYQLNLAEKEFVMPGFNGQLADIIFCRNVLIYFSAELQAQVIKRLVSLLQPGGWLLVAPSELGVVNHPDLTPIRFPGVIVHQKLDRPKSVQTKVSRPSGQYADSKFAKRSAAGKFTGLDSAFAGGGKKLQFSARLCPRSSSLNGKTQPDTGLTNGVLKSKAVFSLKEILLRAQELFFQESYRELVDLIPDFADSSIQDLAEYAPVMVLKARSLANIGELEAAAAAVELAVKADKVDPFYYYLSAGIAREQADYTAAAVFYRQALFLDADFVMAHFSLATLLQQTNRKAATRHLRNVIALLESLEDDAVLPHAEGLSCCRLLEITRNLVGKGYQP
ncbi:MAG: protein-glutamate O-methyltransferase CheR [Pseudomonadota bacterium]|nr:protein-glutamate O-methyltransferase CheR [Pseudomonadota bacterium]